jgi:NADH-quinone oxidoreductase subunit E
MRPRKAIISLRFFCPTVRSSDPGPQNGRYAAEPLSGLTRLKDFESGKKLYNASAQAAVDLGDTVKRIDGSEVPILTPWLKGRATA